MSSVLIVEDDDDIAFGVARLLELLRFRVEKAADAAETLRKTAQTTFDVILLDLGLPDADGLSLLSELIARDPTVPIIVLTGRDDAANAVSALKLGASDYLTKPTPGEAIHLAILRALERSDLRRRIEASRRDPADARMIVGDSPIWNRTMRMLEAAAHARNTPVLLAGESGTGKEIAAALIHKTSERAHGPYVTVNASCFSPALLESELFGHEPGAYTDAKTRRRGLFELADGGTLFLDEVADLPRELQPKLLRAIEGHPFRRVGGEREVSVDVRVVSASNRSLSREVESGAFRADLYQRLCVLEIGLPPLRERGDDVIQLALFFFQRLSAEMGLPQPSLSPAVLQCLIAYSWPGNVRELRNVIERALVLAASREVTPSDLPPEVTAAAHLPSLAAPSSRATNGAGNGAGYATLDETVRRHVLAVYENRSRNLSQAARTLGISRVALRRKLRLYGSK